jgi:hypothetical protein
VHHGKQAGRVIRELGLELFESIFHGGHPLLAVKDTSAPTCCQGINAVGGSQHFASSYIARPRCWA